MHVPTYTLFFVAPLNLFMNWLLVSCHLHKLNAPGKIQLTLRARSGVQSQFVLVSLAERLLLP